jgi:hypothetical protein
MAYEEYRLSLTSPTVGVFTIGDGVDGTHKVAMRSLSGAFDYAAKTRDVDLAHTDGSYAPPELEAPRTIVVDFVVAYAGVAADVLTALRQARSVFGAKENLELTLTVDVTTYVWENVRARNLRAVLDRDFQRGRLFCQGTIICPDPTPVGGW